MGVFGLLLGLTLLIFDGPVFSAMEWLAELAHSDLYTLSTKNTSEIRDGIDTWAWAAFSVAAITLPLGNNKFRAWLSGSLRHITSRQDDDSLPPDRYGRLFLAALIGVLVYSVLAHWSLRTFLDTEWLEGEDGVSEWWSVATYMFSAVAAGVAAWYLKKTKHNKLRYFYITLAVGFFMAGMEEISWGSVSLTGVRRPQLKI